MTFIQLFGSYSPVIRTMRFLSHPPARLKSISRGISDKGIGALSTELHGRKFPWQDSNLRPPAYEAKEPLSSPPAEIFAAQQPPSGLKPVLDMASSGTAESVPLCPSTIHATAFFDHAARAGMPAPHFALQPGNCDHG
jgi:hypothetical protein